MPLQLSGGGRCNVFGCANRRPRQKRGSGPKRALSELPSGSKRAARPGFLLPQETQQRDHASELLCELVHDDIQICVERAKQVAIKAY